MMSASLSLKEIFINVINESLRAHFHLYITNKTRHEVVFNINILVTSDGRALGYDRCLSAPTELIGGGRVFDQLSQHLLKLF